MRPIRSVIARFLVLVLLAGCASSSKTQQVALPACEPSVPPTGAKIVSTQNFTLATWPATLPRGYTGCQRIWRADAKAPAVMQPLVVSIYQNGKLVRFAGTETGGQGYDCRYLDGVLQEGHSTRPERCPEPASVEPGS